jgi:hypothetical protein
MKPHNTVMPSQQLEMIFQVLLPPGETNRLPEKIGRRLSDRQIQPLHIRSVQILGILGVAPSFGRQQGPVCLEISLLES